VDDHSIVTCLACLVLAARRPNYCDVQYSLTDIYLFTYYNIWTEYNTEYNRKTKTENIKEKRTQKRI